MFRSVRLAVVVLILFTFVLIACQRPGSSSEGDNSGLQIALQPMLPEETLVVILTDAGGAPVTDATVALEGNMNHAGMVPVLADAVADDADGSADGHYHLPFTFTMLGDWIITVNVTQADGSSFSRNLDVRASEQGIQGETVIPVDGAAPASAPTGADAHDHGDDDHSDHSDHGDASEESAGAHASGIEIQEPMARPAPLAGGTGAVYFMLHNGGDTPLKLLSAESPAASAVEIHTTINDNGVLRMRQITGGITLEPGKSIHLTPGEMHLMLVGLAAPLVEGDTVDVTLHFEAADDLTFTAPVVAMDDLPADGEESHADH
ncbi:MAG: copper chaperone PCu(A)C [Caldilineaceae bacterium]|nr:copper chaperone PCu(A)C [Caldilineaceae bacterium]